MIYFYIILVLLVLLVISHTVFLAFRRMFVFKIAKKLNIIQSEDAYSLTYKINYLLPRMANKSEQWGHLLFIPGVNFIVEVALWMEIAKKLGKSKIWGLFMIVPILNFVSIWHLSNSDFQEPTLSTGPR